jgi:arginase family enzyme
VKTAVIIFPFDLFGSSGTAAGAQLLADELREILADNRRERTPTRARAYTNKVKLREFCFEKMADYEKWREHGRQAAREVMDKGDFLLWISGNHLGALPVYDELAEASTDTLVVQFDAHLDIHQFTDCAPELSHGNFIRHIKGRLPRLINIGHRDLLLRANDIDQFFDQHYTAATLVADVVSVIEGLRVACQTAKRVFVDIDCDVFDTAYFPAAPQPVPLGLSPAMVLRLLDSIWSPQIAGVLISEFDPARDQNDRSLSALVWLIEWLLLKQYEKPDDAG